MKKKKKRNMEDANRSSLRSEDHHHRRHRRNSSEPRSPKVSCIGNVTRSGNRVVGFPIPLENRRHCRFSYHKLKKLFSLKNLNCAADVSRRGGSAGACPGAAGWRRERVGDCDGKPRYWRGDGGGEYVPVIDVADLDPPLPVVRGMKRPEDSGGDAVSLWKRRRSGGGDLKGLQVRQIRVSPRSIQPVRELN